MTAHQGRGEAFGRPGLEPRWTTGAKVGIGTACNPRSRVWFTLARGIVTEVYYPRLDTANTRDLQFLITDGKSFFHEEQRDLGRAVEYVDARALAYRMVNTDPEGRYQITKRIITDPEANALVMRARFDARHGRAEDYHLFVLFAPHVANRGYGNSGRVVAREGRTVLLAWREGIYAALAASVPFRRASCGFVGVSDGWQDLQNLQMDWEFASATDGNIALTAELDLSQGGEFTLVLGFGKSEDEAIATALQTLQEDVDALERRYVQEWHAYCAGLDDLSRQATDGGRLLWISAMVLKADGLEGDPNWGCLPIRNLPAGVEPQFPQCTLCAPGDFCQCCIVDGGFLELVRYGLRAPDDPHVLKTLPVYDAMLKVETPGGPAWRRYNHDGYGEKRDGSPYEGTGVGRAWPLLTGERGHYELASGRDPAPLITAMERFANEGGMFPEQVWDAEDIPERRLLKGRGTGSATPLAWAHAEYIRLLRSKRDGRVFGRIAGVYERYVVGLATSDLAIWKFNQKIRTIRAEQRLRIEVFAPAFLRWTRDGWTTVCHDPMKEVAPGIYAVEFPPISFSPGRALEFTFYWPEVDRWEGTNFVIAAA